MLIAATEVLGGGYKRESFGTRFVACGKGREGEDDDEEEEEEDEQRREGGIDVMSRDWGEKGGKNKRLIVRGGNENDRQ